MCILLIGIKVPISHYELVLVVVRYRPLNHEFRDCAKISRMAEKRMRMAGGNAIFTDLDDAKFASSVSSAVSG